MLKFEIFHENTRHFYSKTQGGGNIFIVTMTSSGHILVKNSRIFFKNSIFRLFAELSFPHKCTKKSPGLPTPEVIFLLPTGTARNVVAIGIIVTIRTESIVGPVIAVVTALAVATAVTARPVISGVND